MRAERRCSATPCDRTLDRSSGLGFCGKHYKRFKKHGDPYKVATLGQPLTPEDVEVINKRLQQGEYGAVIARDFAVSQQSISSIKTGETWNWLTGNRKHEGED